MTTEDIISANSEDDNIYVVGSEFYRIEDLRAKSPPCCLKALPACCSCSDAWHCDEHGDSCCSGQCSGA